MPLTTEEVYVFARNPRSFVYVQDYSKTRAWIWVKCCVSTSERNPDHSPDAGTGLLSPIAYALQREILLRRENPYSARVAVVLSRMHCNVEFYYVGKIQRTGIRQLLLFKSNAWF